MHPRDWIVCIIEPNKYEAQIIVDILRNAGVERVKTFLDSAEAMEAMELFGPNIILLEQESAPLDAVAWTKAFRRNLQAQNRQAAIFVTARALSRAFAEDCRHGGANALVVKPLSSQTLIATIKKVLSNPRPFIDAPGYVGPCRRAGIVTAGGAKRRRRADNPNAAPALAPGLGPAIVALKTATDRYCASGEGREVCVKALSEVHACAQKAKDGLLMRACAAFAEQLSANGPLTDAGGAALMACFAGVAALADPTQTDNGARQKFADQVRQAVARAAARAA